MGNDEQNIQSRISLMQIIDSHQHFWNYNPVQHAWIDDDMAAIRKNFLPQDLYLVLQANNVAGCVAVQADETEQETLFLIKQAAANTFIKAVVGWVDLREQSLDEKLAFYQQFNIVKGFRHVLQSQEPSFMLQPNFLNGIATLKKFNFTYDILVFPKHLPAVIELVKKNPDQPFVIDHIAKPSMNAGLMDTWKRNIQTIAEFNNVQCKISGIVTEADYQQWKPSDFTPYIDIVVEAFGTKRIMFGSDWPVCLVAASYKQMLSIGTNYFSSYSSTEQADFFGNNAKTFYQF